MHVEYIGEQTFWKPRDASLTLLGNRTQEEGRRQLGRCVGLTEDSLRTGVFALSLAGKTLLLEAGLGENRMREPTGTTRARFKCGDCDHRARS